MVDFEVGTSGLVRTWANSGTKVNTDTTLVGGVPKTNIGWQPQEKPPSQYFNFQMNQLGQKINHCLQNGVPLWNATTAYTAGNAVGYTNSVWLCVTGNTNSAPTVLNSNWLKASTATDIATVNTTIVSLFGNPTGGNPTRTSDTTITLPAGLMAKTTDGLDVIKLTSNAVVDISVNGLINRLDTGTVTNDTWYYVWLVKNPSTTSMGGLLSLSSTTPTLPSGFSKKAFLGFAIRYRNSKIFPFVVDMNRRQFTHLTDVSGGNDLSVVNRALNTSYEDIDITAWAFPLSKSIDLTVRSTSGAGLNCYVRAKGQVGENPPSASVGSEHNRFILPLISDVVIQARQDVGGGNTKSIDIHGYGF
jgi:hypothetical protein